MKRMYENRDIFDFYSWHQEKKSFFKYILCGYFNCYQRAPKFLLAIIYHLKSNADDNMPFELLYSEEATEFLNEMTVQNSI